MGDIIKFIPRPNKSYEQKKLKAQMKGTYEEYTCDCCGADIEVIDGDFPERCPSCDRIISW